MESANGGSPEAVVDDARHIFKRRTSNQAEEKIDELWVVFDVEDAVCSGAEKAVARACRSKARLERNPSSNVDELLETLASARAGGEGARR